MQKYENDCNGLNAMIFFGIYKTFILLQLSVKQATHNTFRI